MTVAPWYIAGPLLGLLIVLRRAVMNKPFGVLGGYIDVAEHATATFFTMTVGVAHLLAWS